MPASLDYADMWRYVCRIVDRVFGALDSDSVMDECLDALIELLGANRGLILLTNSDGSTRCLAGRGQSGALTAIEREEVSKSTIREALNSGRLVVLPGETSAREPPISALTLGIAAAIAIPLSSSARSPEQAGLLYLDFRDRQTLVTAQHVEFFTATAKLLGAVLAEQNRLQTTCEKLRDAHSHRFDAVPGPSLDDLLGPPSMLAIRREIETTLDGESPILILGESGTGKTVLAQAIAEAIGRKPIVRAVLGSSDDLNTITSELFGHEKGSFSGATGRRVGLVEFAKGGTLILDEILNLTLHAQKLLLDFTQFGNYRPLGYDRPEPKQAKLRLIAATNGDLPGAIRAGRFREDLYHRLASVVLELPPLRERREDVPALVESSLRRLDPSREWSISVPLRRLLLSEALVWPGNVRQLEQLVLRARERALTRDPGLAVLDVVHFQSADLTPSELPLAASRGGAPGVAAPLTLTWQNLQAERSRIQALEENVIRQALANSHGVVAHAARELGIARTTLASRMDVLGIRTVRRGLSVALHKAR